MGNNQSCCWSKNKRPSQSQRRKYAEESKICACPVPAQEETFDQVSHNKSGTSNNLQHISEREPDDQEEHPSDHPKANTIFLVRSKSEIHHSNNGGGGGGATGGTPHRHNDHKHHHHHHRKSHHENHRHRYHAQLYDGSTIKKFSSCSTIFIDDSTVSKPDLKNTIKAVSLAIYFHIRNRENREEHELEEKLLDIFDERLHPLTKEVLPDDYEHRDPEHKTIYRFIRTIFNAAQLTAECAIVTLVYLERLLTYADIEIVPGNWRRIVLGAVLLASKVWDDQAVWNVDYCQILKDVTVNDMNELERQFLEMLQFNINVPSSVYAKYYFDLRALVDAHDLTLPVEPLSKERALRLEAMSSVCDDRIKKLIKNGQMKRSLSADKFPLPYGHNRAVLS